MDELEPIRKLRADVPAPRLEAEGRAREALSHAIARERGGRSAQSRPPARLATVVLGVVVTLGGLAVAQASDAPPECPSESAGVREIILGVQASADWRVLECTSVQEAIRVVTEGQGQRGPGAAGGIARELPR
jgi:hypothetical protein